MTSCCQNVLAEHEQQVPRVQLIGEIKECLAPIHVEALDGHVEINQPDGHAAQGDDGQVRLLARGFDQLTLLHINVERLGEDVNDIEADLFWCAGYPPRWACSSAPMLS